MTEARKETNFNDPKAQRSLTEDYVRNVLKDRIKEGIYKPGEYILFHHADVIVASRTRNIIDDAQKLLKGPSDVIFIDKHKIVINPEAEEKQR